MLAADDPELRVSLTFIKIIIIKGIKNVNVCRPYMFCPDKKSFPYSSVWMDWKITVQQQLGHLDS